MAGLLDWLTDGSLGNMGMGAGGANPPAPSMPPVQQTGADGPPLPLTPPAVPPGLDAAPTPSGQPPAPTPSPAPPPDPTPAAGPPDPPVNPATSDIGGGMQGGGPTPPPVPMPQPRPPGADAAPPATPGPGGFTAADRFNKPTFPAGTTGPLSVPDANGVIKSYESTGGHAFAPPDGTPPGSAPYKLGDQTALGRALGIDPKSQAFNTTMAGLGSGLTAAGNSKGKSPFQALTSGAGATLEGSAKEEHAANKDAQGYLTAAINAKKAGDDATYKTNYTAYLAAKLRSEQAAAASKDAAGNKNDSPTQLYLSAQRLVQPDRNAMNKQIQQMQKDGAPPDQIAKAQADGEAAINAKLNNHYATLGIHPQTAAQIAAQPGNSQANPINGKAAGITPENITKKMVPGQYYTNPSNGQLFVYKGEPDKSTSSKSSAPSSKPEPADPMKKEKATTADDDED